MAKDVSCKIKLNAFRIRQLKDAQVTALVLAADALVSDLKTSQTMPFETGYLQNESTYADYRKLSKGKVMIITATPYARRLYYHPEYNFSKESNSNAGAHWFEPYINGEKKKFLKDAYRKFYKKEARM